MNITVVSVNGWLDAVAFQMSKEGDFVEVLREVPTKVESELVLTDVPMTASVPVVGGDRVFPSTIADVLLNGISKGSKTDFFVTKWYDRISGWNSKTIIGIPLVGLMNENMSASVPTGVAMRYVTNSPVEKWHHLDKVTDAISKLAFTGFVTICFTITSDDVRPVSIQTGIPFNGLYPIFEGAPGRISDVLIDPSLLRESWVVGLNLTRYPWPLVESSERVYINGLSDSVTRHFWMPFVTTYRKNAFSDHTFIGMATAWSQHLAEANRRAQRTCRTIDLPQKQFRSDLTTWAQLTWGRLIDLKLVGSDSTIEDSVAVSELPNGT